MTFLQTTKPTTEGRFCCLKKLIQIPAPYMSVALDEELNVLVKYVMYIS